MVAQSKKATKVVIAYNDDVSDRNRLLFELYATDIRNFCVENNIEWELLTPPNLTEERFMALAENSIICYVAAHGTTDSIDNENDVAIVSTRTTNYRLSGKCLFAVSCYCGQNLKEALIHIGVKLFVGYCNKYTFFPGYEEFMQSANSGFKLFVNGCTIAQMREYMYSEYDRLINNLETKSVIAADALIDNQQGLVVEGEDDITINDLIS